VRTVLRVFRYLRKYPGWALGTLGCALASTVLVIVFPKVTQLVVDEVREGRGERVWMLVTAAIAAFIARDGLNCLRIILNNTFEQKVIFDLRSELYSHIQQLPLKWFDNRATGDLMTRVMEDVNSVERVLIDGIEQGAVAVLQVSIVTSMLFAYHPRLAWLALAPVPFLAAGALWYTLTAKQRYRGQRKASSAMNALLHDNLAGIRQIKTYVRESEQHERFNNASMDLQRSTLRVMRIWAIYNPSMSLFASLGMTLVVGFGAQAVLRGELSVGELTGFLLLAGFLYDPIGRLHSLNQILQAGRAAGERVFEILDEHAETESSSEEPPALKILGEVEFKKVSFSYRSEVPVLHDITIHAQPAQTIALVGKTGAGKSTIVQMLTRFYEYETGEILLDGVSIRGIPRSVLRQSIGLVTQESFLFNGTLRENLVLGKPHATDTELWEALKHANAEAFVRQLPEGLDSVVGERGVKLSVGEKQRVSIARVLLKDPPILILDEATASVDTDTERQIQGALENLMRNRTSFVIAHRLSTVRNAHQILVLDHGRIVERGVHSELLALGGLYTSLCRNSDLT
jgi:ABC-type multidrug transport system fused ATPase/permease subunit